MSLTKGLMTGLTKPLVSGLIAGGARQYLNIMMVGASNIGGSQAIDSAFTDQIDTFDSTRELKLDYDNNLVTFANPVNNNSNLTFNLINEDMAYGAAASMVKTLSAGFPSRKIAVASACKSGISVTLVQAIGWLKSRNASDPFDMATRYGQWITRAKNLQDVTGEPIDLFYLPDAGADATGGSAGVAAAVVTAYEDFIPLIKSDLGCPNAVCVIPNLAALPENSATYPRWADVQTALRDDLTLPENTYLLDSERDLGITLANGLQYEFPLSVGESGTWTLGETLTGANGVVNRVSGFNLGANKVYTETQAAFTAGEVVTGGASSVTGTLSSPLAPATVHYNTMAYNRMGAAAGAYLINQDATQYTVALIGDSITSQNDASNDQEFNSQGYMTWLNAITGQRFSYQPSHNLGNSGQSVSQTLDNITDLAALSPAPNLVFWLPFANDITGARSYADLVSDFDDITTYVTSTLGAKLVIGTTLPRTQDGGSALTLTQQTLLDDLNNYIRSIRIEGVKIVDMYSAMVTEGTNDPNPTYFDNESGKLLHPNPAGAHAMAEQYKAALNPISGTYAVPDMSTCALGMNSDMSGTGGSESSALASATIADNWNLYSYSGMTGTATKDGDDKQALDLSYTDSRTFDLWEMQATDITTGFSEGEQYYMEAEAEIISATNVRTAFCVEPTLNSSGSFKGMSPYDVNAWPETFAGTLYLRTPIFTVGASDTNIDPILWAQMNSVGVTSNTEVVIKQARFVRV